MRFLPLLFSLLPVASAVALAGDAPKSFNFSDPKTASVAAPFVASGGVETAVQIAVENGVLHLTNRAGGSFGVKLNLAPFDAQQLPRLDFDYTRSPDTKVNLFFKVNGAYYGVVFCGPPRVRAGSFLLGTVAGLGLKGHATIPLRDWLRRFDPKSDKLNVEEILIGNWDNTGFLLAGIGGNGPGATYTLDNLALSNPDTLAPETAAPRLGKPNFEGNNIVWPLEGSANLDTRTAVLSVDGQKFDFASPFLKLETLADAKGVSHRLILQAGEAGMSFSDAQNPKLSLENARDWRGKVVENAAASLDFQVGSHIAAVPLPRLKWDEVALPGATVNLSNGDFEADSGGWSGVGGDAAVERDAGAGSGTGQTALRFSNLRTASSFGANLSGGPIDVTRFPVLTFAYRADDRLRADFRLLWDGKPYSMRFFDRDNPLQRLGSIDGLVADEKWHLAQVPLLDWMKKARPEATSFTVSNLALGDDGWLGNARGVTWWLDDFRWAPKVSASLSAEVTARDLSGVHAVSWQIDQNPATTPDRSPEGGPKLDIPLAGRAAGLYWLHIRAQNGAGTWSEAAHFPFVVG